MLEDVKAWRSRSRPLDPVYSILFFDAIVAKVRHEGKVSNRAVYLALAINMEGKKELLGMWSSSTEGSKFWLRVLTEFKKSWPQGCLHLLRGRSKGLRRSHRNGLPAQPSSIVHCAYGA